jgi:hypothetical protein
MLHRSSYFLFCYVTLTVALGAASRWASIFLGCDRFSWYNGVPLLFVMCLVGCSPDTSDCDGWRSIPSADHIASKSGLLRLVYRLVKHLLYIDNHMAFTCSPCRNQRECSVLQNCCARFVPKWLRTPRSTILLLLLILYGPSAYLPRMHRSPRLIVQTILLILLLSQVGFLITNFRRVLNLLYFLLGILPE